MLTKPPPDLQSRRQSSAPSIVLPSLNLHKHFGHEELSFGSPVSAEILPEPVSKPHLRRGESLEHDVLFKVELEESDVSDVACSCVPTPASAQQFGLIEGEVADVGGAPGICRCGSDHVDLV